MASITDAKLTIKRDPKRKTAKVKVTAKIKFSPIEHCMMKNCEKAKLFKVRCEIWGDDDRKWEDGRDNKLFTFTRAEYFPDSSPSSAELVIFEDTVGEGVLDEDGWWRPADEIFGKLILTNLFTGKSITRNTNFVIDRF